MHGLDFILPSSVTAPNTPPRRMEETSSGKEPSSKKPKVEPTRTQEEAGDSSSPSSSVNHPSERLPQPNLSAGEQNEEEEEQEEENEDEDDDAVKEHESDETSNDRPVREKINGKTEEGKSVKATNKSRVEVKIRETVPTMIKAVVTMMTTMANMPPRKES